MASKDVRKLLEYTIQSFSKNTFSKSLRTSGSNVKLLDANPQDGVSFTYQIPPGICRTVPVKCLNGIRVIETISVSGALGVMDELSTYSFMIKDKYARSGVSIILSTEILDYCPPGENVTVVSKADKIGKSIGFCTMQMVNSRGNIVARGKHIKFLQHGPIWEFIAHPKRLGITVWVLENIYKHLRNTYLGKKFMSAALGGHNAGDIGILSADGDENKAGSVFQALGVTPHHPQFPSSDLSDSKQHSFHVKVNPSMNNIIGRLHGGAIAMCAEQATHLFMKSCDPKRDISQYIQSMEVRYLSAVQGTLNINCTDDPVSISKTNGVVGRLRKSDTGGASSLETSAQFVCQWAPATLDTFPSLIVNSQE